LNFSVERKEKDFMSNVDKIFEERIELDDGKYTLIMTNAPGTHFFRALRYNEEWRNLTGDNMILAMFQEIQYLNERVKELEQQLGSTT
jgi:hypothetical protein